MKRWQADLVSALSASGKDDVPVTVLVPQDAPEKLRTPEGRHVVVCLAQTRPNVTCASCGLCAQPHRKAIVGFRAHGQFKAHVPELVQLRRKEAAA